MARAKAVEVVVTDEMRLGQVDELHTEHTHEGEGEVRCERCKKHIRHMGKYYQFRGLVIGPECLTTSQAVLKGVRGDREKLVELLQTQFKAAKRNDTIRGMIAKGYLPADFQ